MDMKHLSETASYEDAWKADEPKAEAPKADDPPADDAPKADAPAMDAPASDAPAADAKPSAADEYKEGFGMELPKSDAPAAKPAQPQTFAEAFRMHRAAGDKTFNWNGKSYSTAMASDKPKAAKPAAKPAATDTGDEIDRMAARAPKAEKKPGFYGDANASLAKALTTNPFTKSDSLPAKRPAGERVTSADVAKADLAATDYDPKTLLKR